MALNGQIPGEEYLHQPELQNNEKQTVALILAQQAIIPSKIWIHDCNIQDENCYTVEQYLMDFQLPIPNDWIKDKTKQMNNNYFEQAIYNEKIDDININPNEQNSDGWTIAMIQAINGKIPENRFYHNPTIKNKYEQTVESILQQKGQQVPDQWSCNKYQINKEKDNNGQTEAMRQAVQGIVPDEKYWHDPEIRDNQGNSVCYYLWDNGIIVPDKWQDNQYMNPTKDQNKNTLAQYEAYIGQQIPSKTLYHDPRITNNYGWTVAMDLAYRKIIPPKQWQHDPLLAEQTNNMTVAMHLADKSIIPPECWNHKPELQDKYQRTVAILLAMHGTIPPQQWYHDPNIKDKYNKTVEDYLKQNKIEIPQEWKCEEENLQVEQTDAMKMAMKRQIPQKKHFHRPDFYDENGNTVAMYLSSNGIVPGKEWNHNPSMQNNKKSTVALNLASNGIIPTFSWIHSSTIQDENNNTVALYLAKNQIIPPVEWNHDKDIKNNEGKTVKDYLQQYNMIIPQQWQ